jgi:5'-nucleotidase
VGAAAADISRTQNSAGESALGNLIADAQRATLVADFAFMNPGGIRSDLMAGEVTWGDLQTVQPFNNILVRMNLTGQQIYDVLEQQWVNQPYTRMLQISGLTYTWDNALPEGGRIVEVRQNGALIDRAATYVVVANSYIADGGDNFTVFTQATNKEVGPVDLDALVDYVKTLTQPFTATIEGRITRLN